MKNYKIEEWISKNILKILIFMVVLAAIGGVIVISFYWAFFNGSIEADNGKWGTFGDYFGGTLNPILSFLALIAVLLTIVLQNKELKITRKEMAESGLALQFESFEKNFFEMLRLHVFIVDDLTLEVEIVEVTSGPTFEPGHSTTKPSQIKGRACFKYLRDELQVFYDAEILGKKITPIEHSQYIKLSYTQFAEKYEHKIGHYFRFLYRVFKHINESKLDEKQKKHYSGITRALLSSNELALLFYDCFYVHGGKFAELVIKFHVFENMEFDKLLDRKNHMPLFNKNAYGEDGLPPDANLQVPVYFN